MNLEVTAIKITLRRPKKR